jgi:hypothetical protein
MPAGWQHWRSCWRLHRHNWYCPAIVHVTKLAVVVVLFVLHRVISVDERASVMERLQGFSSQVGGATRLACHPTLAPCIHDAQLDVVRISAAIVF